MKRPFQPVPRWSLALLTAALVWPASAASQEITLFDAVDAALATHPSLASASARWSAAAEAGEAARAARLPDAALEASVTRFQEPMIVAPLHSLSILDNPPRFHRTLVQGRLSAGYTLYDWGGRGSRIRGAEATYEATGFRRAEVEMSVLEETATAFVGVLAARAVLDAATTRADALEEEADRALRRFEAGTAAEVEALRARASLQDALADLASAEARLGLSARSLARVMAVDPSTVAPGTLNDVSVRTDGVGTVGAPAGAGTLESPVLLQADRTALAAEARLEQERSTRFPSLRAGAAVLDYGTIDGGHVLEWQAGLQVSWPLFLGGGRRASIRRAEAEVAAARSELDAARLQVEQAVDAARANVVAADARAEALGVAVAQWEEVARIETLALEVGSGIQSDLLLAQAGLFEARAGHAQARYEAVLARVRLARAEGSLDRDWMDEALEALP